MNSLFFFFFFLFYCSSEDGYCFYENNPTKYFEHGSPLTAEQVEQSFGNTCSLLPRYTPLEFTFSNNEENVYLKLKNITGTTFHLYESKFPDFPNYKISISKGSMVTIAKCEEINFCELLEECSDAFIEIQRYRHQSPLPDDIVYISWKKVVSTLSILVEYEGKITRCRDFTKTINITKVVMQSDKKMPVAYTQYELVTTTTTSDDQTQSVKIINSNISLGICESIYVRIAQCSICSMNLRLKCGNEIVNKTVRSDEGPRLLFSNNFFLYGWNEIELSPPSNNHIQKINCNLEMYGSYDNITPAAVTKFWRTTNHISVLSTQTEKNSTIISTTDDPLLLLNMTTSKIPPNNSEECSCINNYLAAIAGAGFIIVVLLFYIFWSKLTRSSRRGFPL
ncbi:uncharacterized protein LOC123003654 isoform X2 [Tribolium madens]|uniref:uncharacterized protein LOC123003654 isoform X2 n=1 Tax=Tribolium madens TaxID=41895 RepID=UPI001CF75EE1|nr:uncharacterized protein LOC123003654 isoform X2 [Tribolium madens]